jgi:hypothetical protein
MPLCVALNSAGRARWNDYRQEVQEGLERREGLEGLEGLEGQET